MKTSFYFKDSNLTNHFSPKLFKDARSILFLATLVFLPLFASSQNFSYAPNNKEKPGNSFNFHISKGNFGEPVFSCLERASIIRAICILEDEQHPIGPKYFNAHLGYEGYSGGEYASFIYGLDLNYERFKNSEKSFTKTFGNGRTYLGVEGRRFFGLKIGVRFGNIYNNDFFFEKKNNVLPTLSGWIGYKPVGTFKIGIFDDNFFGGSPIKFQLELKINTGNLIDKRFNSLSFGVAEILPRNIGFYTKSKIKLDQKYSIIPGFGLVSSRESNSIIGNFFTIGISKILSE